MGRGSHKLETGRQTGRRMGVVALDQAVSGGSNVLASLIAARTLDPRDFGTFSLVFLVYGLVQAVSRSVVSNPVLVEPKEARARLHEVMGSSWLVGVGTALLTGLVGLALVPVSSSTGWALCVFAICVPLLTLQDVGRFVAIGLQRAGIALRLDVIWLVLLVGVVVVLQVAGISGVNAMVGAWAGSGAVAGLYAVWVWRARGTRFSAAWLTATWHLSWRFAVTFGVTQVCLLAIAAIVRAMFGSATVGALLGAQLLMRPYTLLESALVAGTVAEVAHHRDDMEFVSAHTRRITVVAVAIAALNGAVMVLLPDAIGRQLLGATWASAKDYLPANGVLLVAIGLSIGARAGMVGLRAVRRSMILSVAVMILLVGFVYGGALVGGGVGCAWGLALGWFVSAIAWWAAFRQLGRRAPVAVPVSAA
ncbi:MATE family efflux transporter [Nocardioides ultimimeridianus]